ncbi:hypothetical protein [Allomuricauda sp.]|uniref:hypothetical protein n=1 Tax=Flagellimonas sp. TaxID=2058762 RepID=UPI001B134BC7|nr:hypothetical protein [Allomuricauda sp.]MBO6828347.1 collagen-like protein [Allomuricauda sp.]
MKTTTLNFLKMGLYAIIGLSITLTSCSGEDGEDGLDGMDGINGEQGPQGPAGEDGNANVIASDWQTIQWDDAIPTAGTMVLEVPELDLADFVETGGVVMVYFKLRSGEDSFATFALPFMFNNATYSFYTTTSADTGVIVVRAEDPDSQLILDIQNDPDFTLRYVLVPANVAETTSLNFNNYNETSKILGL